MISVETFSSIDTPAILLDYEQLVDNIRTIQKTADDNGAVVRPHIKTHKCHEIARLQFEAGAVGVTAAKTDEAIEFMAHGAGSVTVAYPLVVPTKLDRLFEAVQQYEAEAHIVMDSETGLTAISEAAERTGTTGNVLLKVDVGLHRCGLQEDDPNLLPLVRRAVEDPSLRFLGLLAHAGHAYGAQDSEAVRAIARDECEILGRVRKMLEGDGIAVPVVSVGSTPTVLASDSWEGITEIRPGNYVFMDRTPLRLGLIERNKIALTVLASVVSKNSDYFIVDAGSKTLSSDMGAHGTSSVSEFGEVYPVDDFAEKRNALSVAKLSEEHGFVARNDLELEIGSQVRIIPNHSCVVANLLGEYIVLKGDGETERWRLAAQSFVH